MRVQIDVRIYEDAHGWQSIAESEMTVNAPYPVLYDQSWGDVVSPLIRRTLFDAAAQLKATTTQADEDDYAEDKGE